MSAPEISLQPFIRALEVESSALSRTLQRFQREEGLQNQSLHAIRILQDTLSSRGKIVVTGLGKSGKIAQKVAATLTSTGSLSVFMHATEGLHGDLGILQTEDCVLAFSQTGNTEELLRLLPGIRSKGVKIVAVAGNADSSLVSHCDAWLDSSVELEACPLNLAPTSSTTVALALGDALAVTLMSLRGFQAEDFAKSHPGGTLGRRLNLQVRDLMIPLSSAPTLQTDAKMSEIISVSTQGKAGAVLILSPTGDLEGLITDGDIRRALVHPETFFSLLAENLMTRNPISIQAQDSAWNALRIMEDRPSQINVLPVLDQGRLCGLIRLHDLVKNL